MEQDDEPAARVATTREGRRTASRLRCAARFIGRFALPGVVAATLVLGFWQIRGHRRELAERERLAAAAAMDRQSRDDQIRVWSAALRMDPRSALALGQLAALNVQKARETGQERYYPVAEAMARRSLQLRTHRNAKTYVVLASTLLAQHRFADARDAAAAALALEPDVVQYRALLAEIHMELGDYAAAGRGFAGLGAYRAHLSIGPRLARWAEVSGQPRTARDILERLVTEAEGRRDLPREQLAWFHVRLGDHYSRHGSQRRARASLARALDVNPGDYRAHKALAELDLVEGNAPAALEHARSAVAGSRTPETLLTMAAGLRESESPAAAQAIEREVSTIVGDGGGSFERAWHAYRLEWNVPAGDVTRVLEREVAERGDVQGYDLLAWAYYRSGRLADARTAIASAVRTGTSDATVWFHAGVIAHASGEVAHARTYLKNALRLNPALHHRKAGIVRSLLKSSEKPSA